METEIKLRMSNENDLLAILEHPLVSRLLMPDSRRETELANVYYDTASRNLTANRMTLRLRKEGDLRSVTLKTGNVALDGLHQRFEWTASFPDDRDDNLRDGLDTGWFKREATSIGDPDAQLQAALKLLKNQPLDVVCESRINRVTLDIGYGDSLMELALDRGELIAGELTETVCELEIELKEGDVRDLIELGQDMQAQLAAVPEPLSKYARCLVLLEKQKQTQA